MSLSVAIIQTRYLGDVILTVPLIREIQRFDKESRITVIVNEGTGYPLAHFPGVRVLSLARGGFARRGISTVGLVSTLIFSSFDLLLDLTVSDRSRMLTRLVRAEKKGALGSREDLNTGISWKYLLPVDTNEGPDHRIRMQTRLLESMGVASTGVLEKAYFPDPVWIERAKSWITQRSLSEIPILFLHPGGRHWFKRWPPDRFALLAKRWVERTRGGVVVAGSGSDRTLVDSVINGLSGYHVFPLTGAHPGLLDGLIRWSTVFVGSDSGPLHMADAAHVPLIGLFGSTLPSVWGPTSSPHGSTLFHRVHCSPCRHTGCTEGPMNCLALITVDEVFERIEELIR